MMNFGNSYLKYVNHLEQINDAALQDPVRMIEEVEDAICHLHLRYDRYAERSYDKPPQCGKYYSGH